MIKKKDFYGGKIQKHFLRLGHNKRHLVGEGQLAGISLIVKKNENTCSCFFPSEARPKAERSLGNCVEKEENG